ncbi:MAG: glycosyltransferase family A protein [Candidatus Saccharimonadales bacterium]
MKKPLVSVIVPTKNSSIFLDACLKSICEQTYENIEIIIVDNYSTDSTQSIAHNYTEKVFIKGPERSSQRNYGVKRASGYYVLFIDSDMVLTSNVIDSCVGLMSSSKAKALIIPEESFGIGFWAKCKKLERSFYINSNAIESARFFDKEIFQKIKGFNENLISGEDWELSQRIREYGQIDRVKEFIFHNEGKLALISTLKKKYYYAYHYKKYMKLSGTSSIIVDERGPIYRYRLFFSQPKKLFKNPLLGIAMLFMKTSEYFFGGLGYITHNRTIIK